MNLDEFNSLLNINVLQSKYINLIIYINIWSPPSLSELTPMIFNTRLTHLRLEASIYYCKELSITIYDCLCKCSIILYQKINELMQSCIKYLQKIFF